MNINKTDIFLYESERMADFDDSGGQITAVVIDSADLRNVFPDIDRIDEATGNVSLRKFYVSINTTNTEPFAGAHAIVSKPPADPLTNVLIFKTDSWTDERLGAQGYVEAYSVPSGLSIYRLLNDQPKDSKALTLYMLPTDSLPDIGGVLFLDYNEDGQTSDNQYVRVTQVLDDREQEFTEVIGGNVIRFTRRVVIMEISTPLKRLFPGADATTLADPAFTRVRLTIPNQISRYYGISPLSETAAQGSSQVKLSAVFQPAVPASQSEVPVVDQIAGNATSNYVEVSSTETVISEVIGSPWNSSSTYTLFWPHSVMPGTVNFTMNGINFIDDGRGNIIKSTGSVDEYVSGTITYGGGNLVLKGLSTWSGFTTANVNFNAKPGFSLDVLAETELLGITDANISTSYAFTAPSLFNPGSFRVDYMAEGKWYSLYDNGTGGFTGDGSGSINYATGSIVATLLRQPDPNTAILYAWSPSVQFEVVTNDTATDMRPSVTFYMVPVGTHPDSTPRYPVMKPGTVAITWDGGGTTGTINDDGQGNLTGDGAGTIKYADGQIDVFLTKVPPPGTVLTLAYTELDTAAAIDNLTGQTPNGSGEITFTIAGAPIVPGTCTVEFYYDLPQQPALSVTDTTATGFSIFRDGGFPATTKAIRFLAVDDGSGFLYLAEERISSESGGKLTANTSQALGTINYTTGAVTIKVYDATLATYTKTVMLDAEYSYSFS